MEIETTYTQFYRNEYIWNLWIFKLKEARIETKMITHLNQSK